MPNPELLVVFPGPGRLPKAFNLERTEVIDLSPPLYPKALGLPTGLALEPPTANTLAIISSILIKFSATNLTISICGF